MDFYDILGICSLGLFDADKAREQERAIYHSSQITPKKFSYRPEKLENYIGQERAKELININLEKIRTIKPVHFIISGSKGTGKSSLAYIIASELKYVINTYVAGSFTMANLYEFLDKNENYPKTRILFVDEIHSLSREMGEFLYPILEDFLVPIGNIRVKPFIFIGATTDKNILAKRLSPMIDRCQSINLEHYSVHDIKLILKQYNDKVYQVNIEEEAYNILSKNCRYTPRLALSIFDDFMITKDVNKVLHAHQIIKDSLTSDDLLILKHLIEINKPIGSEVLSIIIQQTRQDYQTLIEPFLLQEGYITRTARGRLATDKANKLLQELK